MTELLHRIKVFLYRFDGEHPEYLLLKPDQGIDPFWGPMQSALGFGEKLETAIRHHARVDIGLDAPGKPLDLDMAIQWQLGDEHIVEWNYGLRCLSDPNPALIAEHWKDHRWTGFETAYPSLQLEFDRQAILRLHTRLGAA